MQTKRQAVSAEESAALLQDPPRLHARWRQALAEHHHLHGPEAAALLGVPEAALMASATGQGNLPLQAALGDLLAPVAQWGRVLVAVRNRMGVALGILGQAELVHDVAPEDAGTLCLRGGEVTAWLATAGAARIDLFEEEDGHGHTFSLNWFDSQGHAIGRLFLMSKSGRDEALPWLRHHALPGATGHWRPGQVPPPPMLRVPLTCSPDGPGGELMTGPVLAEGRAAAAWATAAILCADRVPVMHLGSGGAGAALRYVGALGKTSHTPPMAHATDLLCKLHARPLQAASVSVVTHTAGVRGVLVADGEGGGLLLHPQGMGAAAWFDTVAERTSQLESQLEAEKSS